MLGFLEKNDEGLFKPAKVKPLNDLGFKAKKAVTCSVHSLILFEDPKTGKEMLYSVGTNHASTLGVTDEQLGDADTQKQKPFREIPSFVDTKIADFALSEKGSLVILQYEGGKPVDQLYKHTLPDGTKCQGLLHFYKKGNDWHFVTPDQYEAKKNELPPICFAIKCPIDDI